MIGTEHGPIEQTTVLTAAADELAFHIAGNGEAGGCYALAYGSHADGTNKSDSDLDLVLVSPGRITADQMTRLTQAVLDLHRDHGLALDVEVAYEVKLAASHDDVRAAVRLDVFPHPPSPGAPVAPPVPDDPAYLNSEVFRRRLLLNALTSAHVFLGGDLTVYRRHTQAAETALAILAVRILIHAHDADLSSGGDSGTASTGSAAGIRLTLPQLVRTVAIAPNGETYRDYLGYHPGPALVGALLRGLCELRDAGVVTSDPTGANTSHGWRLGPRWSQAAAGALEYWR